MAEMRLAVDVINRGGDVKPFVHRAGSVADKDGDGKLESRMKASSFDKTLARI
jgi:hypothetical protein